VSDEAALVGVNIERLREARGLSKRRFAQLLGLSAQTVGNWESGTSTPSSGNLIQLAKFFGVSISELLKLEDDE
jgi:transcriptional regulator with XRE-family HTH domain